MPKDSIFDFGDKFSINSPFDDWTKDRPRILRQSNLLTREGAERKTGESNIYAHVTNLKEESINNYYIETEYEGTPLLVNHSVKIDKKGEKIYFRINLYFVEEGNWAGDKYYEFRPSVPFFFKLGYSYSFTSKLFLRGTSKPLNKMKGGFPINEEAKDPRYGLNKPTSLSHEYKGYFGIIIRYGNSFFEYTTPNKRVGFSFPEHPFDESINHTETGPNSRKKLIEERKKDREFLKNTIEALDYIYDNGNYHRTLLKKHYCKFSFRPNFVFDARSILDIINDRTNEELDFTKIVSKYFDRLSYVFEDCTEVVDEGIEEEEDTKAEDGGALSIITTESTRKKKKRRGIPKMPKYYIQERRLVYIQPLGVIDSPRALIPAPGSGNALPFVIKWNPNVGANFLGKHFINLDTYEWRKVSGRQSPALLLFHELVHFFEYAYKNMYADNAENIIPKDIERNSYSDHKEYNKQSFEFLSKTVPGNYSIAQGKAWEEYFVLSYFESFLANNIDGQEDERMGYIPVWFFETRGATSIEPKDISHKFIKVNQKTSNEQLLMEYLKNK